MSRKAKKKNAEKTPLKSSEHRMLWSGTVGIILAALAFGVVVAGLNFHGLTYDEPIYVGFGTRSAQWLTGIFTAFFDDTLRQHLSAATIRGAWYAKIDMQPPLVQVLAGLSNLALKDVIGGLIGPRLPMALFFAVAVVAVYWLTEEAFSRPAGIFAALGLLLLPRFFAGAHVAALDVPVSAMVILTAAVFYLASEERSWNLYIGAGALLGLALLAKLNAAFLVGALLVWTLVFHRRMIVRALVACFVVAPVVFFIGWPWLWHDPLGNLGEYLSFHLRHYPVLVYYLGELHEYAPWHYPFVMTAVTVPTLLLVLMAAGLGYIVWGREASDGRKVNLSSLSVRWLLVIGAAAYLLPSAMPFAPKYNGVRLFLPAFVFLLGLAGGGFSLVHEFSARALRRLRATAQIANLKGKAAFLLALIFLLPSLVGLSRVYPYERAYYNRLIGGPAGAQARGLETIYWGGVFGSALSSLNALEQPAPRVFITPRGATSMLEAYQNAGGLRADLQWTTPPDPAQQTEGWPGAAVSEVDWVIFQCAQSEFDALSWALYNKGTPDARSIYLEGVPLLLIFRGDEARRVFAPGGVK